VTWGHTGGAGLWGDGWGTDDAPTGTGDIYGATLDPNDLDPGNYSFTIHALDPAGNERISDSISFSVANPASAYTATLDPALFDPGDYSFTIHALDPAGNERVSPAVHFAVSGEVAQGFWPTIYIDVAFDADALYDATDWTTLDGVEAFNTLTGRTSELESFPTGTAGFTLDNTDRRYDVDNEDGPYFGDLTYNRQIRVRVVWDGVEYPLWRGYVPEWGPNDANPGIEYNDLAISANDAFSILDVAVQASNPFTIGDPVLGKIGVGNPIAGTPTFRDGESSGDRITRILDLLVWPSTLQRIDSGRTRLIGDVPSDKALTYMQRVERSEMGRMFIGGDGALEYHERRGIPRTIAAMFSDNATDLDAGAVPYVGLTYDPGGRSTLKNDVTRANPFHTINKRDSASIHQYGDAEDSQTDLLTLDPEELQDQAGYVVSRQAQPKPRITAITITPETNPDLIWPLILGLKIGQRIEVARTPKVGGTPVAQTYTIESRAHNVNGQTFEWQTTFGLAASPDEAGLFTIGVSAIGGPDVLAY